MVHLALLSCTTCSCRVTLRVIFGLLQVVSLVPLLPLTITVLISRRVSPDTSHYHALFSVKEQTTVTAYFKVSTCRFALAGQETCPFFHVMFYAYYHFSVFYDCT